MAFICLAFIYSNLASAMAQANMNRENMVRAKIGIQISSGDKNMMAKSRDRLKSGDLVRIFIHPEKAAYIYVIYSDQKQAVLLNSIEQKIAGSSLVLPSVSESYEIDGTSSVELFTIICSPKALPRVTSLFSTDPPHGKWASLEADLVKQSRVKLTEKSEAPFAIAGNVRGAAVKQGTNASFKKKLRVYSGNSFLVKQYEFRVKQ